MATTVRDVIGQKIKKDKEKLEGDQILHLRAVVKKLEKDNKKLRKKIGEEKEFFQTLAGAVEAAEPLQKFKYKGIRRKGSVVIPVLVLSDLHLGEVIKKNETEGFGRFNYRIAERRLYGIVTNFLQWVEINRSFYRIQECALFCLGDYVSGDIHDELKATNEFPLPVQTAKAGLLLGEVFRIIAAHFDKVTAYEVGADNHGRLQRKPQSKQKTSNNMSYLVHTIANEKVSDCQNLTPVTAEGMKLLARVNDKKFLLEHGDKIKGWAGFPYYGMGRMKGKEAQRRMNTNKGFDYWVMGHFHVPAKIDGNIYINGSLSGTSEFDHSEGRHAKPSQVAFFVGKHGIFNETAFNDA